MKFPSIPHSEHVSSLPFVLPSNSCHLIFAESRDHIPKNQAPILWLYLAYSGWGVFSSKKRVILLSSLSKGNSRRMLNAKVLQNKLTDITNSKVVCTDQTRPSIASQA